MNCQDFERIILPRARHQLLEATAREQGLAHTAGCVRCAARLAEERALIAGVRAVVAEIAKEGAPARVEAALLAAFREQAAAAVTPAVRPMPTRSGRWPRWVLVAAATVILVLIPVLAIFWQQSGSPNQKKEVAAGSPTPSTTASGPREPMPKLADQTIDRDEERTPRRVAQRPRSRMRHSPRQRSLSEVEVATDFFPLMEGDDLDGLESGQVVRVKLPGSALIAVGLPIDAEMASAPVKADVVLGPDGLARAIRFVR